jgi:hypothetical protein
VFRVGFRVFRVGFRVFRAGFRVFRVGFRVFRVGFRVFRVGFRVFRVGFRVFRVGSGCSGWGYRHPIVTCEGGDTVFASQRREIQRGNTRQIVSRRYIQSIND